MFLNLNTFSIILLLAKFHSPLVEIAIIVDPDQTALSGAV